MPDYSQTKWFEGSVHIFVIFYILSYSRPGPSLFIVMYWTIGPRVRYFFLSQAAGLSGCSTQPSIIPSPKIETSNALAHDNMTYGYDC